MNKLFIPQKILAALIIFLGLSAQAQHGGPAEQPGEKSGEKGKNLPEWVVVQGKIQTLEGKIGVLEVNLKKLLDEKAKMDSRNPELSALIKSLISMHRDLVQAVEDRNKQEGILKFRFPERAAKMDRSYQKNVPSLEELEQEVGVDYKLSQMTTKLEKTYGRSPASKKGHKKNHDVQEK